MKPKYIILLLLMLLIASAAWNVRQAASHRTGTSEGTATDSHVQLWTCGMHPTVIQDHPGNCPICGMKLVPMNSGPAGTSGSANTIRVDPAVIQSIGVRTNPVRRQTIHRSVRTNGVVTVDETRQRNVNLKYSGWVEKLYADKTGQTVRAGEKLFDIYSPMLVTAMQEYLLAFRAAKFQESSNASAPSARALEAARRKLLNWNVSDAQIQELEQSGTAPHRITVFSPADGTVMEKNVIEGESVMEGANLYRIVDLSHVWVNAEIYEYELPWIEVGQLVKISLPYGPGYMREGRIGYIYPYLDQDTRTATIRVVISNPDLTLKPDMYVTLDAQTRAIENALVVPREAVVRSGKRDLVFLALGEGKFEPRQVEVGLEADGNLFEIRSGLEGSEQVVTSAQFLFDSETQLQEALNKLMASGGSQSDLHAAMGHSGHGSSMGESKKDPAVHLAEGATMDDLFTASALHWCPMHHDVVSPDSTARCPLCEMPLKPLRGAELASLRASNPYGCVMCPVVVPGEDKDKPCPICEMRLKRIEYHPTQTGR